MFRKRTRTSVPDEIRRAFGATAALVDEAQRRLLAAVPTSRDAGIPLSEALNAFIASVDAVSARMPAWRNETTAHEWTRCSEGVDEARRQATDLQRANADLTFEQLNAAIGDVLYPLE